MNINLIYRHPCELEIESLRHLLRFALKRIEPGGKAFRFSPRRARLNLFS